MTYPQNLGEGKHLLTAENELQWLAAQAAQGSRMTSVAAEWLDQAARPQGDPGAPPSAASYWRASGDAGAG